MSESSKGSTPIFPPWHFGQWQAVDDRVRGGSSQSHLDPVDLRVRGAGNDASEKVVGARFWGTLDIKTLGGAGFASQRYMFGPTPLHLSPVEYDGITLDVGPDISRASLNKPVQPHTFTLVLKTEPQTRRPQPPDLPPSPEPSSLSYEHDFHLPSSSNLSGSSDIASVASSNAHEAVHLKFSDFKPVYRGRPMPRDDPRYRPFDSSTIYELSLMCRSGFGKQEGEFGIVVAGISGLRKGAGGKKGREGCWGGIWRWIGGIRNKDEGSIKLDS